MLPMDDEVSMARSSIGLNGPGFLQLPDDAFRQADDFEFPVPGLRRKQRSDPFRPLDDGHAVARQIFLEADFDRALFVLDAVEIDVIHGETSAAIFMHDGKGGAGDVATKTETASQPFREFRFSRAENAGQGKYFAADEIRRPALPEGLRGLNAA